MAERESRNGRMAGRQVEMTRVIIIDSKQIHYSDNAYRGENVDWSKALYDQDNIDKVNQAIVAEVRDSMRGVHVIDNRHWHEMPRELQEMWKAR